MNNPNPNVRVDPPLKFNEENRSIFCRDLRDDSGLSENGFSPFEFPESGGKMLRYFRDKFKKR